MNVAVLVNTDAPVLEKDFCDICKDFVDGKNICRAQDQDLNPHYVCKSCWKALLNEGWVDKRGYLI